MDVKIWCSLIATLSIIVWTCDCLEQNQTIVKTNAERFERILHRQRRFLLFPPGSAIVVSSSRCKSAPLSIVHCFFFNILCAVVLLQTTLSFTKTLVPRSPSGINLIGECDVFYPLQTQISDWYLTPPHTRPQRPPPPPPPSHQPPLPPYPPPPPHLPPPPPPPRPPPPPPPPAPLPRPVAIPINLPANGPYRFPTDQQLGITAGTLVSDPNFNVGTHPGEIYVDDRKASKQRAPNYSAYRTLHRRNHQNTVSCVSAKENSNTFTTNHRFQIKKFGSISKYEDSLFEDATNDVSSSHSADNMSQYDARREFRSAKERRDLYEQIESLGILCVCTMH